eukprot:scaffold284_cov247-Ochromonas_danica.AAC.7
MEKLSGIVHQLQGSTNGGLDGLLRPIHTRIINFAKMVPGYWEHNEEVLREIIQPFQVPFVYAILSHAEEQQLEYDHTFANSYPPRESEDDSKGQGSGRGSSSGSSSGSSAIGTEVGEVVAYNSLVQVLVHLRRDWSEDGQSVRQVLYRDRILQYLKSWLPPGEVNSQQVLIPGMGLGRLAFDLAVSGYRVEGNECSAAMLCASYSILTSLIFQKEVNGSDWRRTLYPTLHFPFTDDWDLAGKLKSTQIPYIEDSHVNYSNQQLRERLLAGLSLQFGDFVSIYSRISHISRFNGIVTCFFIDTGRNLIEYLEVIRRIVKPGGVWINVGPLHYHNPLAIPYSYRDVLMIIDRMGFDTLQQDKFELSYCGEEDVSMKPEIYHVPIAAFRRRTAPDASYAVSPPVDDILTTGISHIGNLSQPNYIILR